jgi:hypothetical protein
MRGERYVRVPERGFRFWWETELDLTRHRSRTSYAWALSDEILLIDGILLDGPRNPSPCVNSNGYLFHKEFAVVPRSKGMAGVRPTSTSFKQGKF